MVSLCPGLDSHRLMKHCSLISGTRIPRLTKKIIIEGHLYVLYAYWMEKERNLILARIRHPIRA